MQNNYRKYERMCDNFVIVAETFVHVEKCIANLLIQQPKDCKLFTSASLINKSNICII